MRRWWSPPDEANEKFITERERRRRPAKRHKRKVWKDVIAQRDALRSDEATRVAGDGKFCGKTL